MQRFVRHRANSVFTNFDTDQNQALDFDEFCNMMEELVPGLPIESLRAAFASVDADHSGSVDVDEFLEVSIVLLGVAWVPLTHTTPNCAMEGVLTRVHTRFPSFSLFDRGFFEGCDRGEPGVHGVSTSTSRIGDSRFLFVGLLER